MIEWHRVDRRGLERSLCAALVLAMSSIAGSPLSAQLRGLESGQWQYLGGDAGSTRSNPQLTQIDASNFADLQAAWTWRGDNFGEITEFTMRATPV